MPPTAPTEPWRILEYFWCPKDNIEGRVKRDHVPYDRWAENGFITTTDGDLTDVRFIIEQITEINGIGATAEKTVNMVMKTEYRDPEQDTSSKGE